VKWTDRDGTDRPDRDHGRRGHAAETIAHRLGVETGADAAGGAIPVAK